MILGYFFFSVKTFVVDPGSFLVPRVVPVVPDEESWLSGSNGRREAHEAFSLAALIRLPAPAPLLPHLFGLGVKACFCRACRAVVIMWCKGCGSWGQSCFPEQVMCASSPEGSCWGLLWCLGWTSPLSLEWRGRWKVPFRWAHRRRRGSSSGQGPPKDRKSELRMSFLAEV